MDEDQGNPTAKRDPGTNPKASSNRRPPIQHLRLLPHPAQQHLRLPQVKAWRPLRGHNKAIRWCLGTSAFPKSALHPRRRRLPMDKQAILRPQPKRGELRGPQEEQEHPNASWQQLRLLHGISNLPILEQQLLPSKTKGPLLMVPSEE